MLKRIIIFCCFISLIYQGKAQDKEYARQIITTLTSPKYAGRGYTKNGDQKAAKFITTELKKNKVAPLSKDYWQSFPIQVNTFPSNMEISIDGENLIAGEDFLVNDYSCSVQGTFPLYFLSGKELSNIDDLIKKDFSGYFIVMDTVGTSFNLKHRYKEIVEKNSLRAKGIIEIIDKTPIHGISIEQENFAAIKIKRNKITKSSQSIYLDILAVEQKNYSTQNIQGYIKGATDSTIVFCCHYDHLGTMGKNVYFPGANDNGSGIAMVINLAKYYTLIKTKPYYTLVFLFFSAEELGLLGSYYFTQNPTIELSKIRFLINLDVIGSGEKGIQIVNSTIFKKEFEILNKINSEKKYLPAIQLRGEAANSDHYYFYKNGVPSFFIYTLGNYKEYHNIYDKANGLPLTEYNDLFKLLTDFVSILSQKP